MSLDNQQCQSYPSLKADWIHPWSTYSWQIHKNRPLHSYLVNTADGSKSRHWRTVAKRDGELGRKMLCKTFTHSTYNICITWHCFAVTYFRHCFTKKQSVHSRKTSFTLQKILWLQHNKHFYLLTFRSLSETFIRSFFNSSSGSCHDSDAKWQ